MCELGGENDPLVEAARTAAASAHCPYSRFEVGAALLADDGRVFTGCNVENASFGLTVCAERTALFKAVSEGARNFTRIAVYTPTPEPSVPCGACRQVLAEFAPDLEVVMACDGRETRRTKLSEIFPTPFRL